jgi:hypothetical protein
LGKKKSRRRLLQEEGPPFFLGKKSFAPFLKKFASQAPACEANFFKGRPLLV